MVDVDARQSRAGSASFRTVIIAAAPWLFAAAVALLALA